MSEEPAKYEINPAPDFYCDDNECWGEVQCKRQCAMCMAYE